MMHRGVSPEEYRLVWDAISHLLGDGFDEAGASVAQCYGQHARRSADTKSQRIILPGGVLDADALIELGQSLQPANPQYDNTESKTAYKHRALAEEIERVKLMGAVRPPDDYEDWFPGAAAFKREHPDDEERAFACFDAWSACSLTEYKDTEDARCKFDRSQRTTTALLSQSRLRCCTRPHVGGQSKCSTRCIPRNWARLL